MFVRNASLSPRWRHDLHLSLSSVVLYGHHLPRHHRCAAATITYCDPTPSPSVDSSLKPSGSVTDSLHNAVLFPKRSYETFMLRAFLERIVRESRNDTVSTTREAIPTAILIAEGGAHPGVGEFGSAAAGEGDGGEGGVVVGVVEDLEAVLGGCGAEVSTTNCTLDCTRRRLEVEGEGGVALEREACGFTGLVDLLGGVGVRVEEEENGAHRDKKEEEGGFDYLRIETRNGRNFDMLYRECMFYSPYDMPKRMKEKEVNKKLLTTSSNVSKMVEN
ncbi:hypothetical protein HKD37_04G010279 [Glycine soja]